MSAMLGKVFVINVPGRPESLSPNTRSTGKCFLEKAVKCSKLKAV